MSEHRITRRTLLVGAAGAAVAAPTKLLSAGSAAPKAKPAKGPQIAIQLYSLRSLFGKDAWGTMSRLADTGVKNVELAGTYGASNTDFKKGLDERGMKAISAHISYNQIRSDIDGVRKMADEIGFKYVVVPGMPTPKTKAAWIERANEFSEFGAKYKKHGLDVGFHNHAQEFAKIDGEHGLDIFFEHADASVVFAEPDLAWVKVGGADPVAWLKKWGSRCRLSHYKDVKEATSHDTYCPGAGILDWGGIIEASTRAGMDYAIMEFEANKIDPVTEARMGRDFLRDMGLRD